MGNMSCLILLFIVLSTIESRIHCLGKDVNSTCGCISEEREALLKFKASLLDPSLRLSSWNNNNTDCCIWPGVMCDEITGHVIMLDLGNRNTTRLQDKLRGTRLDSSLLELKHLSYLDLSFINFQGSSIPSFLGSMKQLRYLNLSSTYFGGVVPHHLGNLSSLRVLDLSSSYSVVVDDLAWVSRLSSLERLDMSKVDLSPTKDLLKVLNMLPSLVVLSLSFSRLGNTNLQHACVNSTLNNILSLDLSRNNFIGEFPCFLHNMTSLTNLDLSHNQYKSHAHCFLGLRNLVHINLGSNSLPHKVDWVLELLRDKCHLKSLDLNGNQLFGEISELFQNSSRCWNRNLERLDLSENDFCGHLPQEVGELKKLTHLDLCSNKLSGNIPLSLGNLSNLESLDLSNNSFAGTLSEAHFANISNLEYLSISSNMFKFRVRSDWMPHFQLKVLDMGSCDIVGGQFPQWLLMQKELIYLDISDCNITRTLPKQFHYPNLQVLDLHQNHLVGPIPDNLGHMMPSLKGLLLSHNFINGSIPDSLCEMKSLRFLDLTNNYLSGNLPDCWANLQKLEYLMLSSNKISGVIPNSIGGAYSLRLLSLKNNSFTGDLPFAMRNCTELEFVDIRDNRFSGKFPKWIGKCLPNLKVLSLRNNDFFGAIPLEFCRLLELRILDLGNNNLTGSIPHCFGYLSGMVEKFNQNSVPRIFNVESLNMVLKGLDMEYTTTTEFLFDLDLSNNNLDGEIPHELTRLSALNGLNLSYNHLEGEFPVTIGDLKSLESLDLSNNRLFGSIPESLSSLDSLGYLNLSNNNLSGQIPTGRHLQTLDDPSIYGGNPGLYGTPLPRKCDVNEDRSVENHVSEDEEEDEIENVWLYGFVICGYATGFWVVIGILVFKKRWSQAFFEFIEMRICKLKLFGAL